jgi:thiol-disulfide isomerase/thioredoxin
MALIYTPPKKDIIMPDFNLPNVLGGTLKKSDLVDNKVTVVMFLCNHCPYVQAIENRILNLATDYLAKDQSVGFIAICSNDANDFPEDSFDAIKEKVEIKNFPFPYLYDEDQSTAKKFEAVCTPDIFVFNKKLKLNYRGRFDDSWKDEAKVKSEDLRLAIEATLNQKRIDNQIPSMGCSIKWKNSSNH